MQSVKKCCNFAQNASIVLKSLETLKNVNDYKNLQTANSVYYSVLRDKSADSWTF